MIEAIQLESQSVNRGRPTKFTPERIQQICNLVERGKSRDEIAEIIGVTTGTLQVTCSKLGVQLAATCFLHWYRIAEATSVARSEKCLFYSILPTAGRYDARICGGT